MEQLTFWAPDRPVPVVTLNFQLERRQDSGATKESFWHLGGNRLSKVLVCSWNSRDDGVSASVQDRAMFDRRGSGRFSTDFTSYLTPQGVLALITAHPGW
jgi:hypothetical protein